MAKKKHPILTVFMILGGVALFLGLTMMVALKVVDPSAELTFADKIGVVFLEGAILDSRTVNSQLIDFRENKNIKVIVLRIDSPGGAVGPTQEIYQEILKTVEKKHVVASLGSVAASGGYYIAAAADKIVANPGTITGSIGVIMEFFRFQDLLDKIGVQLEVMKSGEFKDIGSPHREMTSKDRDIIDSLISDIQTQFVAAVAQGRDLPVEKVSRIADGRIFSGVKAKELELVDVLGNFQDAVNVAKDMAGISGDAALVYPRKSKMELWESFLEGSAKSVVKAFQGLKPQLAYRWRHY